MSGARQFSLKWQNPAARVPLREIVFADASPQTPGNTITAQPRPRMGLFRTSLEYGKSFSLNLRTKTVTNIRLIACGYAHH